MKETRRQKIARYERLQKHYRCALWEAEKVGNWTEAKHIKQCLAEIEPYLERLIDGLAA